MAGDRRLVFSEKLGYLFLRHPECLVHVADSYGHVGPLRLVQNDFSFVVFGHGSPFKAIDFQHHFAAAGKMVRP